MGTNYYLIVERGKEQLHIGKQSAGWRFAANMEERVLELLIDNMNLDIQDEYGRTWTYQEFKDRIQLPFCYPFAESPKKQYPYGQDWC